MSRWGRKARPPAGFDYLEPTLAALEAELREKVNEPHEGKRKNESLWPVHQINWQRSRYIFDMYYRYKKISREVYDYCVQMKLVDAALAAKWKKPGYEKLCCTYAINTKNFKFGTVAICRVPKKYLSDDTVVEETNCGCRGCSSGDQGERNIFGNKYGQYLAAIQVRRERRQAKEAAAAAVAAATEEEEEEEEEGEGEGKGKGKRKQPSAGVWADGGEAEDEGDDNESEEEDEDDYGPSATSGKRGTEADAEAEAYMKLHKKSKV